MCYTIKYDYLFKERTKMHLPKSRVISKANTFEKYANDKVQICNELMFLLINNFIFATDIRN